MYRKLLLPFLLILFVQITFAQTIETKIVPKTETEISAELKKQAVEFLRESAGEVGNMRTLENRISFASEMASLMWFHDEKEARTMMNAVVGDFKQLLVQYDSQINASGIELGGNEHYYGGFLGGGDQSDKARLMRKLAKAMSVRQQMTLSIAEHDPQYALDFYTGSLLTFSNPQVRKRFEEQDKYFEARLVNEIAAKDAGKALELGRKSLAKGLNYGHIELLKKIYEKDADKGAVFAEEIAGKLKDGKVGADDFYILGAAFRLGADNYDKAKKDNKKPMFTEQNLRDLAELTAQGVLKRADSPEGRVSEYLGAIEKYAPSRAVQIRAKTAADKMQRVAAGTDGPIVMSAEGIAVSGPPPPPRPAPPGGQNEKNEQEEMMKSLQTLGKKELPKEQREKVIAQARKIIAATPNRLEKIAALAALAGTISKLGDKELADEIMKDAQGLLVSSPKNYQDFMEVWILASGFAQTDAEKAFPVLDDTIFRLNETISAFVKVGEFIDLSGEMIEDGEVQVGSFGGSMVKELTRSLGMADVTILSLAKADFAKTKALTDKFERQEVRILAKMLVLRAILGDKKKPTEEN